MAAVRTIATALVRFTADASRFNAATRQAAAAAGITNRQLGLLQRRVSSFNRAASVLVRRLTAASAAAGAFSAGFAIRRFTQFEETMARVQGISQATTEEFRLLQSQALELGRTTRFSATQAAEGQLFLARAGFEVAETYRALPGTLQLAQAAAVELGQAADIVSNVLAGFQASANETADFVDVLAATANSANTDILQLGEAMTLVAPLASNLGESVADTSALIGTLSNAGIQATLAGTALRGIFAALIQPVGAARTALERYGLNIDEVNVANNRAIDVLRRLAEANISAEDALTIFGRRQVSAFLALQSDIAGAEQLAEALANAGGTAAELARIQDDTLSGAFRRVASAAEGFAFAVLRTNNGAGTLRSIVDGTASAINFLTDNLVRLGPLLQNLVGLTIGFAIANTRLARAAAGAVADIFALSTAKARLAAVTAVATTAARALARVLLIGFAIEGVVILGQAFLQARREAEGTRRSIVELFAINVGTLASRVFFTLQSVVIGVLQGLTAGLRGIIESVLSITTDLGRVFFESLVAGFTGGTATIGVEFGARLAPAFSEIGANASRAFTEGFRTQLAAGEDFLEGSIARSFFAGIGEEAAPAFDLAADAAVGLAGGIEEISNSAAIATGQIEAVVEQAQAITALGTFADAQRIRGRAAAEADIAFIQRIREGTQALLTTYASPILTQGSDNIEAIQERVSGLVQALPSLASAASSAFASIITGAQSADQALRRLLTSILDTILQLGINTGLSSIFGIAGLPTFQAGGIAGTGLALVGERGPEIIRVDGSTRVTSNDDIRRALTGETGGPLLQVNIDGGFSEDALRQVVRESEPQLIATVAAYLGTAGGRNLIRRAMA